MGDLFTLEDYIEYYEKSLQAKEKIISMLGGTTRVYFKIDDMSAIKEQSEVDFKKEFKERYKEEFGVNAGFFKLVGILNSSNVLENRHTSGKKMTKVINGIEELGEKVVLMYSQIKNSYIIPDSYLSFSVDPFDFIMMGTGKGWTTCYKPGGEHYTGGYSLSLDGKTFLTYVSTTEPSSDINHVYSKIYRRLGVFTKDYDGVKLSTQYPYKNKGMEDFTTGKIKEYLLPHIEGVAIEENEKVKIYKVHLSQIYNDYTNAIKNRKEETYIGPKGKEEVIKYGKVVKCLHCKKKDALQDLPICLDCELLSCSMEQIKLFEFSEEVDKK